MVITDNELIASYMGWKLDYSGVNWAKPTTKTLIPECEDNYISGSRYAPDKLRFNEDWNWLMPVVEYIESKKYTVDNGAAFWYDDDTDTVDRSRIQYVCIISDGSSRIRVNSANFYQERESKIKATFVAVVEFIKQANENRSKDSSG